MADDDDDDAAAILLHFLDELLIYEPNTILDPPRIAPSKDELGDLSRAGDILKLLRRYVRPRQQVLHIRRAVNAAVHSATIPPDGIYADYISTKRDLDNLKAEKEIWAEKLRGVQLRRTGGGRDVQLSMAGEGYLKKVVRLRRVMEIYRRYVGLLLGETQQVHNQTTLVCIPLRQH
jgi:hypothetical protein